MHLEVVLIGHRHAVEIGRSSHSVYSNMSRLQKIGKENSSFSNGINATIATRMDAHLVFYQLREEPPSTAEA